MAIHPSLRSPGKDKKPRSVLKRAERLRIMMEKKLWKEGDDVYGLPKIKTVRIKIKKEKKEVAATAVAPEAPAATTAAATEQAPAKGQAKPKAKAKE